MSITIEDIPNLLLETNKYNYLSELLTLINQYRHHRHHHRHHTPNHSSTTII